MSVKMQMEKQIVEANLTLQSPHLAPKLGTSRGIGERLEALELIHTELYCVVKVSVKYTPKNQILRPVLKKGNHKIGSYAPQYITDMVTFTQFVQTFYQQ